MICNVNQLAVNTLITWEPSFTPMRNLRCIQNHFNTILLSLPVVTFLKILKFTNLEKQVGLCRKSIERLSALTLQISVKCQKIKARMSINLASIYLLKVNNINTRTRFTCLPDVVLMFLLLTLNIFHTFF